MIYPNLFLTDDDRQMFSEVTPLSMTKELHLGHREPLLVPEIEYITSLVLRPTESPLVAGVRLQLGGDWTSLCAARVM